MKIDAIIFDKDGTLIDFDAFWVSVSRAAIDEVTGIFGMDKGLNSVILAAFGIRDGITDPDGVLCKGTYEQMGEIVYNIFSSNGCKADREEVINSVTEAYNKNSSKGEVKPTCERLRSTLTELKARGKRLAVVTTDNEVITKKCLDALEITELFDTIYTDDGKTPTKPDPFCALDFCRRTGISKDGLLMVGDTLTDIRFARNAGISVIGLARNEKGRALLLPEADAVISEISGLLTVTE